ncbi:MAG: alpha/beta fold hydrolase [Firmicutes bacterium]|nr:alpha/beta fold hydrolase [Bacillota bacterium]
MERRWVSTERAATSVWVGGEGPPLVLLHGSGPGASARANWQGVWDALAARYQVVAPDLVGFGDTQAKVPVRCDLNLWVNQVVDVVAALGIGKAHWIGNSMGGAVALGVASRHPELVERMVLMGSVGVEFPLTEGLAKVWGYRAESREALAEVMRYFVTDPGRIPEAVIDERYRLTKEPEQVARYAAMFPEPLAQHIAALATAEDQIAAITAPVCLIHGREDQVIPVENSWRLLHLLPRAELHVLSPCGHWTQVEKREEFLALVFGFLRAA